MLSADGIGNPKLGESVIIATKLYDPPDILKNIQAGRRNTYISQTPNGNLTPNNGFSRKAKPKQIS